MMTMVISGSDGVTFPDSTTQNTTDRYGFVNRIINGDMRIDQRNAGAAVTAAGAFPVDRWSVTNTTNGAYSAQQNSSAPAGFNNSLLVTITTAQTAGTGNLSPLHHIEGFNIADLGWGTASAQPVTLSFWVRSSLTGTFGGALRNSAADRSYPFTYTISAANTWEYKTITINGETSGTWLTTNGRGVEVRFSLFAGTTQTAGAWFNGNATAATGQTQLASTLNATWYITGVQLEVGSVATPFERRPYGTELNLCYRYFEKNNAGTNNGAFLMGYSTANNQANYIWFYKVTKRAAATISVSGAAHFFGQTGNGSNVATTSLAGQLAGVNQTSLNAGFGGTSFTLGQGSQLVDNNSGNSWIAASAEL
jgi:hypothetical protein